MRSRPARWRVPVVTNVLSDFFPCLCPKKFKARGFPLSCFSLKTIHILLSPPEVAHLPFFAISSLPYSDSPPPRDRSAESALQ